MKSCIFAHFGVISLVYLFVCMYISYKEHNRLTKETFLIVSDVGVNIFPALRGIPFGTTNMNLRSCILNRHKMRQSQIATNQESLRSHFVIMAVTAKTESNYTEIVFGILGRVPMFTFDMDMKSFIFADSGVISLVHLFVCISVIMTINDVPRKLSWKGLPSMWTCFQYLGVHHRALLTSIWDVVFWTVTICTSHELRQVRNSYRRNLWFVVICDQDCALANSVK